MFSTLHIQNRIDRLRKRDPERNKNIIRKLKRELNKQKGSVE